MSAIRDVETLQIDAEGMRRRNDRVAIEVPVALLYNGEPFAVMMATPDDVHDFALGFSLSEAIVSQPQHCRIVDVVQREAGIAVHCAIPQTCFDALGERRRNLEGRSGCGLCGSESLQAALRPLPAVPQDALRIAPARLHAAMQVLSRRQPGNAATGGLHAAAFLPLSNDANETDALLVREDVGRHNALDKVIGAAASAGLLGQPAALLVTSRASFELVQKAVTLRIPMLAAISAPTSLAIDRARDAGLTLLAFVRGDTLNAYSHAHRILPDVSGQ